MAQDPLQSLQKDWADTLVASEAATAKLISKFQKLAKRWQRIQELKGLSGKGTKQELENVKVALGEEQNFISGYAGTALSSLAHILLEQTAHDPKAPLEIYESLSASDEKAKKTINYIEEKVFGVDLNPPTTRTGKIFKEIKKRLQRKPAENVVDGAIAELKDLLEDLSTGLKTISEYGRQIPPELKESVDQRIALIATSVQDWVSATDYQSLGGRIYATTAHLYETSDFIGKEKNKILAACINAATQKDPELKSFVDELVKWKHNENVLSGSKAAPPLRFGLLQKTEQKKSLNKNVRRSLILAGIAGLAILAFNKIRSNLPDPATKDVKKSNEAYLKDQYNAKDYSEWMSSRLDTLKKKPLRTQLEMIDSIVDSEIKNETDTSAVRPDTYWALPLEVIRSGHGDGREKAFLKQEACKYVGIPETSMRLSSGTSSEFNRMVLVVKSPKENPAFILDNKDAAGHVSVVKKPFGKVDNDMINKTIK